MNPHYYGIVEMVFTGVVVLGLAVWQLWSIGREQARDRIDRTKRASAERAGHPIGQHRLDDR